MAVESPVQESEPDQQPGHGDEASREMPSNRSVSPFSGDPEVKQQGCDEDALLGSKMATSLDKDDMAPARPGHPSRHNSALSISQLKSMFSYDNLDTDTYGVSETRDDFFDAFFLKPPAASLDDVHEYAKDTLPKEFDKRSPLSPRHFVPRQLHELRSLLLRVLTTRSGIRLLKTFTAFFTAYVLCLVPAVHAWLGRYSYVMVLSVVLNHPARPFGSQLDGVVLTVVGTAAGLGWGVVGLLLSTSTLAASAGYGGILAMFLALFMASIAWIRAFFIRFYQGVVCAGVAIAFTTLAQTSELDIRWQKLFSFAIPWLFGQVIALLVNCLVFPDAGSYQIANTLHEAFDTMQAALIVPRPRNTRLRRRMIQGIVELSQAYRDIRLDLTITAFELKDVGDLRNQMQAVLRALLSMETETDLFARLDETCPEDVSPADDEDCNAVPNNDIERAFDNSASNLGLGHDDFVDSVGLDTSLLVIKALAPPTESIIICMRDGLLRCDASLMQISGYRRSLGVKEETSADVADVQTRIKSAKTEFDTAESTLLESGNLPPSSIEDPAIVRLFVFARHVRETAGAVEHLLAKVAAMQSKGRRVAMRLPSYPWRKAIHRTNAQIRHDRGAVTAGSYQTTFTQIAEMLDRIKSREHKPHSKSSRHGANNHSSASHWTRDATTTSKNSDPATSKDTKLSYTIWRVLHRLEGFESKYAFKVCLVTSLLAIPSYLQQGGWWDKYEAWWAVAISWIMMHPTVGGNLQDLFTRAISAVLGALWSVAAHAAGHGSPYVMAVFAAIYMVPMLYRYTQSAHPRSGLVGCFSFTVISLTLHNYTGDGSYAILALRQGVVFFVGTTVPIIVNWVLWPFVARHELRYALSSMMFFMSVLYRSSIAKYVYFEQGMAPTEQDIERSEILEGRLREGFVRIRQLLVLTRHEIRLRAPFDPLLYSALADACERFFEYIIAVRHSALFYNPDYIRDNPIAAQKLLGHRRDAVAAILGNLYILAGALRSQRKVPRYLPSAVAARKKLLVKTVEVEEEMSRHATKGDVRWQKKWSDIYSYSYNESLTGCVAQLEELEKYTKLITGEQRFEDEFAEHSGPQG